MNKLDQILNIIDRCAGDNPVTEIKDITSRATLFQYRKNPLFDGGSIAEKNDGIQITLHRGFSEKLPGVAQVSHLVNSHNGRTRVSHWNQKMAGALAEVNSRYMARDSC